MEADVSFTTENLQKQKNLILLLCFCQSQNFFLA